MEPLAYKLRPATFDDIIGQAHLIGPNGTIRKMVNNKRLSSMILYGAPGIGKTTIAMVVISLMGIPHFTFNASSDNKALLKKIIEESTKNPFNIIIVDEIHRMKKDIQDYLLPFVEKGIITMIGITTINPYHAVNPAIRSRCVIYRLKELTAEELNKVIDNSLEALNMTLTITTDARQYLISMANGEVRTLINMVEAIAFTIVEPTDITIDDAKQIILKPSISYDKDGDNYFDTLSGLQKSIRGSDVDASLHYVAKLLATEDLLPLIRRLYAIFYEDISLANPTLGPRVKAACEVALELGMPEAVLPFASIVIEMALSPKSNSSYLAIHKALKDIEEGRGGRLPAHLKNTYAFDNNTGNYKYPHDYPGAWVNQQYLPDTLKDVKYYEPKTLSKYEEALKARYEAILSAKTKK